VFTGLAVQKRALSLLFGLEASVSETSLYLVKGAMPVPIYISWNCVGWQSFVLFVVTPLTGLQANYTRRSMVETVILGFLGTFLAHLLRISIVCVVACYVGQPPTVVFHDYRGDCLHPSLALLLLVLCASIPARAL